MFDSFHRGPHSGSGQKVDLSTARTKSKEALITASEFDVFTLMCVFFRYLICTFHMYDD